MAKKSARPSSRHSPENILTDVDGNEIHNELLLGLVKSECQMLLSKLEFVRLQKDQILHEPGSTVKSAYFPNSGMVSILTVFADGKSVEVGLSGSEGFVGLALLVGFHKSANRAVVQIAGTGFRIDAETLKTVLKQCPKLERELQRLSHIMGMEAAQIAACNRLHEVEERLARWLLMCSDRIGNNSLPLSQELLSQMLGTRRASVTIAAGTLRKAGLIAYSRADVEILDRAELEQASCECYGAMQRQKREWRNDGA